MAAGWLTGVQGPPDMTFRGPVALSSEYSVLGEISSVSLDISCHLLSPLGVAGFVDLYSVVGIIIITSANREFTSSTIIVSLTRFYVIDFRPRASHSGLTGPNSVCF